MGRKWWGVLTLAAALVLLWIVPRALDPGVSGSGIAAPLPRPPPVGACLVDPGYTVVDCSEPHHYEVTIGWPATEPHLTALTTNERCNQAHLDYLGVTSGPDFGVWNYGTASSVREFITAPAGQRLDDKGWKACVVSAPGSIAYTGSIRLNNGPTERPAAFGNCYRQVDPISCLTPHDGELIATTAFGVVFDDAAVEQPKMAVELPTEDVLLTECQGLADDLVGRSIGNSTELSLELEYNSQYGDTLIDPATNRTSPGTVTWARCLVQTTDGLQLNDSLIGIGDKPLPIE